MYKGGNPKNRRMLFLPQTGVAAINIAANIAAISTSIHTSLGINNEGKMYPVSNK